MKERSAYHDVLFGGGYGLVRLRYGLGTKHKTIAPIEEFTVSDEDFEALKQYAKSKNFTYDRQSEKVLRKLKRSG